MGKLESRDSRSRLQSRPTPLEPGCFWNHPSKPLPAAPVPEEPPTTRSPRPHPRNPLLAHSETPYTQGTPRPRHAQGPGWQGTPSSFSHAALACQPPEGDREGNALELTLPFSVVCLSLKNKVCGYYSLRLRTDKKVKNKQKNRYVIELSLF